MCGNLFQDLVVGVGTDAPQRAGDPEADRGRAGEPGVRIVDGELRYSERWLDAEAVTAEDIDRGA
jgi:hypothetical protein